MIKRALLATLTIAFMAGFSAAPASASHCPTDVEKIKAAIPNLEGMQKGKAEEAAEKGLKLHKQGKHGESIKVLHEAMESLGIKH